MTSADRASAFAPASVGNVGVGFDALGHALSGAGDTVTATRRNRPGVDVVAVEGVVTRLPKQAKKNTSGRVAVALLAASGSRFGVDLSINKGIALSSGMGGSAASAVASAVAVNALLERPFAHAQLLDFALEGESVASGSRHADNVAPSLLGGLVLAPLDAPPVRLPVPTDLRCVLVRPTIALSTRAGRALLRDSYSRREWVIQAGHFAAFVSACHRNDHDGIARHLLDTLIEPQRKERIPGFDEARNAALAAGALGCSISGSGPAVFAWCRSATVHAVAGALNEVLARHNGECEIVCSVIDAPGAHLCD